MSHNEVEDGMGFAGHLPPRKSHYQRTSDNQKIIRLKKQLERRQLSEDVREAMSVKG